MYPQEFDEVEGTIAFTIWMDEMFDALNRRHACPENKRDTSDPELDHRKDLMVCCAT